MLGNELIWVRGAGELGSGVAHLLHRVGFHVFMSEISPPLAIRRPVTFSDAILESETEVEGIQAKFSTELPQSSDREWNYIPVLADLPPQLLRFQPSVIVDARMLKHYTEDFRDWADLVIGLGPGFDTRVNCHRVIETMRGHDLGRIISDGAPLKDTGIPGNLGGKTSERLIRAGTAGNVTWQVNFGDMLIQGQPLGNINNSETVIAPLDGMIRGMISPHTPVTPGLKIGDVDPRGGDVKFMQISEKARVIASGVFEAIVLHNKDQRL